MQCCGSHGSECLSNESIVFKLTYNQEFHARLGLLEVTETAQKSMPEPVSSAHRCTAWTIQSRDKEGCRASMRAEGSGKGVCKKNSFLTHGCGSTDLSQSTATALQQQKKLRRAWGYRTSPSNFVVVQIRFSDSASSNVSMVRVSGP